MKQTKKLTVSATVVALGAVLMRLGSLIDLMELTIVVFASLLVAFVYIELGSPYTWLVWLSTTALTAIGNLASSVWLIYLLIFGIYPIIKGYIERLPRVFWLPIKLVFLNISLVLTVLGCIFIVGISFADMESLLGLPPVALYIIMWVLMNIAFVLYDMMIVIMIRFYMQRLRPRFKNLLK